jgi:hypothetical protein
MRNIAGINYVRVLHSGTIFVCRRTDFYDNITTQNSLHRFNIMKSGVNPAPVTLTASLLWASA